MPPLIPDLTLQPKSVLSNPKLTTACITDLLEANRILQEAKNTKDTKIVIKSIPLADLRFVSFSDASFATRSKSQSQKGCLILAASKQIGEWQASDVSPLMWYSRKIARVVASTLASSERGHWSSELASTPLDVALWAFRFLEEARRSTS